MKIGELIYGLNCFGNQVNLDLEFQGITIDSRKVVEGDVFIAIDGLNVDGHLYLEDAFSKGAIAAIADYSNVEIIDKKLINKVIFVKDTRKILGILASRYNDYPTQKLKVVGVTGTNGKTTVTHLISNLLQYKDNKVGILSTTGHVYKGEREDAVNTTPSPLEIQKFAKKIVEDNGQYLVMEVSSHGIVTGRITGTEFDIAVFTNITQDHLDFHKTFENYRKAKGLFLTSLGTFGKKNGVEKHVILNADDPNYEYFDSVSLCNTITYGIRNDCDVKAKVLEVNLSSTKFRLISWLGEIDITIHLAGEFSIYNSLAAISVGLLEGMTLQEIKNALEVIRGVPGRFEVIKNHNKDYNVVIDYAHTPDGLENVLKTATKLSKKNIILVFGCGGNRDKGKRPLMGEIAGKYAYYSFITNDNPRFEKPEDIAKDIVAGFKFCNYEVVLNREEAIKRALMMALAGDMVLIVGKGHENYQIIGDEIYAFDDKEIAQRIMKELDLK